MSFVHLPKSRHGEYTSIHMFTCLPACQQQDLAREMARDGAREVDLRLVGFVVLQYQMIQVYRFVAPTAHMRELLDPLISIFTCRYACNTLEPSRIENL